MKKIGELNFKEYHTEFFVSETTAKYLETLKISLASLLPNGWRFYEVMLFDALDENNAGKPDAEYGKNFKVIYNGIILRRNLTKEGCVEKATMQEKLHSDGTKITEGTFKLEGPTEEGDYVKYVILTDN